MHQVSYLFQFSPYKAWSKESRSIDCNIIGYFVNLLAPLWCMYLSEYKNTYLFLSRLQDWRCLWCRACVHSTCRGSYVQHCSLGETRPYTVPPTCLIEEGTSYILGVIHKLRWQDFAHYWPPTPKIQQTKMLVTCQRFDRFVLIWAGLAVFYKSEPI